MPEGKYFFIRSKLSGLVLDIKGEKATPGTQVVTWDRKDSGNDNQLWWVDRTDGAIISKLDSKLALTINSEY